MIALNIFSIIFCKAGMHLMSVLLCLAVGIWSYHVGDCHAGHDPIPWNPEP